MTMMMIMYGCVYGPVRAKFGANPSTGVLGEWVKYNEMY